MTTEKKSRYYEDPQPLDLESLKQIAGGFENYPGDFEGVRVRCPVAGCNFECRDFGEMNAHVRTAHPHF